MTNERRCALLCELFDTNAVQMKHYVRATVRAGIKLRLQKPCASENNKLSKQRPIPIHIKINTRYTAYKHLLLVVIGGFSAMLYYKMPIF